MKRGEKPEPVSDVLGRVLKERGFAGRLAQGRVVAEWPDLVGSHIAAVTKAEAVAANSVLVVSVKTHAWMTELTLMEREILATINRVTASNPIRKIHWQLMR